MSDGIELLAYPGIKGVPELTYFDLLEPLLSVNFLLLIGFLICLLVVFMRIENFIDRPR